MLFTLPIGDIGVDDLFRSVWEVGFGAIYSDLWRAIILRFWGNLDSDFEFIPYAVGVTLTWLKFWIFTFSNWLLLEA